MSVDTLDSQGGIKSEQDVMIDSDGNVRGKLRFGLVVGENEKRRTLKSFVMRASTLADMIRAEDEAGPKNNIAFEAALFAGLLVSMEDYNGPFSLALLKRLRGTDVGILRLAHARLEALGEADAAPDAAG